LGQLRGVLSAQEVAQRREELVSSAEIIARTTVEDFPMARELAAALWHLDSFVTVGGGPSYATAMFIAAKLMEQPQKRGAPVMLEEWAHLDYFLVRPQVTPTLFVVPPGRSRDRAIEQIHGARDMGATVIAICDSEDREVRELSDYALPVMGAMSEEFSPLTYIVPGQLFATSLHQIVGRKPFIPPFTEAKMEEINYRQIWQGGILDA
jgi:glucosamine--fructose-6-phosphate aminotransferase (isomerizing)